MGVTSKDIAKLAGVSRSAVSSVLNGHLNKVSLEKREKILAIARDLQYRPNPAALVLAKKTTRQIGLVTSPFMSAIYSELVSKISFNLKDKGYTCSIVLPGDAVHELESIRNFESFGVDGIIGAYFLNDLRNIKSTVPILSMSPYPGQYELRVDLRHAARLSVEHLREHGHERIALLCPKSSVVPLQMEGYLKAVGAKASYCLEVTENPNFKSSLTQMIKKEKVTAFAATNDLLAARFMRYLFSIGLNVPKGIAIIGFDGAALAEVTPCPLTTVVFPASEIAEKCVNMLLEKIKNKDTSFRQEPILVKPSLHIGGSCGCPVKEPETLVWKGQTLTLDGSL